MKKINLLLGVMLLAVIGVFTGCEETDPAGPSLDFSGSSGYTATDATVAPGATFSVKWTATAGDAKLEFFSITRDGTVAIDNTGKEWNSTTEVTETDIYVDEATFTVPSNTGTYVYSFKVTDKDGVTDSKDLSITVESTTPVGGDPIDTYTGKVLGGATANAGSWFATTTGAIYKTSDVGGNESVCDIAYNSAAGASEIVSADQTSLGTAANTTQLGTVSVTATEFDAMTDDTDISGISVSGTTTGTLSANTVYGFITTAGKKGLIKVTAIDASEGDDVTIDVKVQQ